MRHHGIPEDRCKGQGSRHQVLYGLHACWAQHWHAQHAQPAQDKAAAVGSEAEGWGVSVKFDFWSTRPQSHPQPSLLHMVLLISGWCTRTKSQLLEIRCSAQPSRPCGHCLLEMSALKWRFAINEPIRTIVQHLVHMKNSSTIGPIKVVSLLHNQFFISTWLLSIIISLLPVTTVITYWLQWWLYHYFIIILLLHY